MMHGPLGRWVTAGCRWPGRPSRSRPGPRPRRRRWPAHARRPRRPRTPARPGPRAAGDVDAEGPLDPGGQVGVEEPQHHPGLGPQGLDVAGRRGCPPGARPRPAGSPARGAARPSGSRCCPARTRPRGRAARGDGGADHPGQAGADEGVGDEANRMARAAVPDSIRATPYSCRGGGASRRWMSQNSVVVMILGDDQRPGRGDAGGPQHPLVQVAARDQGRARLAGPPGQLLGRRADDHDHLHAQAGQLLQGGSRAR